MVGATKKGTNARASLRRQADLGQPVQIAEEQRPRSRASRRVKRIPIRPPNTRSPPRERRLIEVVNPARPAVEGALAELVEDRPRGSVDRAPRELQAEGA